MSIVRWEQMEAPSEEDYPEGGVFHLAADCPGIGGDAKRGDVWRMTVDGDETNWELLSRL